MEIITRPGLTEWSGNANFGLRNDVLFVFSDGEENGDLGANQSMSLVGAGSGTTIIRQLGNGPAQLREAIRYFEQAVALDSSFVAAWAELSAASSYLYTNAVPSPVCLCFA